MRLESHRLNVGLDVPPQDVVLQKGAGPLGLSIVGGSDHSCVPFGPDEPGVFISKVSVKRKKRIFSLLFVFMSI